MRVIKKGDRVRVKLNEPVLIEVNNRLIPVILTQSYSCKFCPLMKDWWCTRECFEWVDCLCRPQGMRMVTIEEAVE